MANKVLARGLRKRQTDAERLLWYCLRNRRFAGYKFRRQHVVGCYIVDFVWRRGLLLSLMVVNISSKLNTMPIGPNI